MSAFLEAIGKHDFAVFQWLRLLHSPHLDTLMAGVSDIAAGARIWIVLTVLIVALQRSRWPAAIQVLLAIGLTIMVTEMAAKPFVQRSRPFEYSSDTRVYGRRPPTSSFPSGHAANAAAAAYTLSRLAPEARAIFWILAVLIAFSRVYLGVHYPGDIVFGVLLGLGVGKFVVGGTTWRFAEARDLKTGVHL
jgi:undecaprenyl-diphosphatase